MTLKVAIKVERSAFPGVGRVTAAIEAKVRAAAIRGVRRALPTVAAVLQDALKSRAPRRTGRLRRSIEVRVNAGEIPSLSAFGVFYARIVSQRTGFADEAVEDVRSTITRILRTYIQAEVRGIRL